MLSLIKVFLAGVLVSCYIFPFEFTFLPGVNTKMMMAAVSLCVLAVQLARGRSAKVDKSFFILSVIALLVSLICYTAVTINGTNDYTYATYIISMWVWLGGAYVAVSALKKVHGYLSIRLICDYLIAVCVLQCTIALLIDASPIVKSIVDRYIMGFDFVDINRLSSSKRLYGIGAALDVAGTRFCVVLIMIATITVNLYRTASTKYLPIYLCAFIFIAVVGNMIARTTTVGLLLAIVYWLVVPIPNSAKNKVLLWMAALLIWFIPYLVHLYNVNLDFKSQISFAFEGFFSLAESGKWDVASNNNLKNMIVFPESLKTWIIGDGYMENPWVTDPYYVGPTYSGYYRATDIGYLRFIFYFGFPGLLLFMFFFFKIAQICTERFPSYKLMFWFILIVNYIIWLKVATDIFVIFALFLCISKEDNDAYEIRYENSISDPLDI